MSSEERSRVAVKYGADDADRHEIGIMFNSVGAPVLVFSVFGQNADHQNNYGATHPLVRAHARMGRKMLDATQSLGSPLVMAVNLPDVRHDPSNKG
nr:hypothetical protein [Stackebrandtia endophytica]